MWRHGRISSRSNEVIDFGQYLHQQAIDTTTPSGKAFYGMLGVFAEFERDMIAARVQAGIDRARAKGTRMGRPTVDTATAALCASYTS
ncbi:MAG: recombinase family protein, partial [Terriglobia bacterium]